ncbi:MAG: MopE-related protein, partial [Bacteroidota bacterium]
MSWYHLAFPKYLLLFLAFPWTTVEGKALPQQSSFSFCGIQFVVPDNSCTPSSHFQFNVQMAPGMTLGTDVFVKEFRLIVGHNWVSDLDMYLISPSGVKVELSTDNGGGSDHYGHPLDDQCEAYTAFSMSACQAIEAGDAPFIGRFLPEGNLNDFHDGSDPSGTWTLQICDDTQNDIGVLQFVELLFTHSGCLPPSNHFVETLTATSADIQWDNADNCNFTLIEYGPVGFQPGIEDSPGEGTIVMAGCGQNQHTVIDQLMELTAYDVYLRNACVDGAFSENSCVLTFTTGCSAPPITVQTDFDEQSLCGTSCGTICPISGLWSNQMEDQMDWLIDRDGTNSTRTGPSDDISGGGHYVYIETSGSACQQNKMAILQSECMDIQTAEGTCHLSFYYHMYGVNTNQLTLQISFDGGLNWTNLWSLTGDQGDRWFQQYIDLSDFDGQVALFRFLGRSGFGFRGDIALDEIVFYGPQGVGLGNRVYYADFDQDSFGNPEDSLLICAAFPPDDYVTNALDCNDENPNIHPNAVEIICNQQDENCNGNEDDRQLPVPPPISVSICAGEQVGLSIDVSPFGQYYWFDAAEGGQLVHLGSVWNLPSVTESVTYYVQDSVFNACVSPRAAVTIIANTVPSIFSNDLPLICRGSSFDLTTLTIEEVNQTSGTVSFHSATPTSSANVISPIVSPEELTSYFIRWETPTGCFDETSVEVAVDAQPTVVIETMGATTICPTATLDLLVEELGTANGEVVFDWDDGSKQTSRKITGGDPGTTSLYTVIATDEKGCTGTSQIEIHTLESINSVDVLAIQPVETCGGNDGLIALRMLNGIPPYEVSWMGPVNGSQSNVLDTFRLENIPQGTYRIRIRDSAATDC